MIDYSTWTFNQLYQECVQRGILKGELNKIEGEGNGKRTR